MKIFSDSFTQKIKDAFKNLSKRRAACSICFILAAIATMIISKKGNITETMFACTAMLCILRVTVSVDD